MAAAPVNEGKIIVGAGVLSISLDGSSWTGLGGTEDGVEFTMNKEFFDVQAAEAPVTLRKEITQMSGTVTCNLLEATLENLLLMWPGAVAGDVLTVYTDGSQPTRRYFKFEGTGVTSGKPNRTVEFPRVIGIGPGGHRYNKGASTVIACEFEILSEWDTSADRWEFGTIADTA